MKLCYVAQNELHYWKDGQDMALNCQRITKYHQAMRDLGERSAWKYTGSSAQFQQRTNPYADFNPETRITAVAAANGYCYYACDLNHESGAISKKELEDDSAPEGIVLSHQKFDLMDMTISGDTAYGAYQGIRGERHIARIQLETGDFETITTGDTVERHPSLSADGRCLYYDAAGYARNEYGHAIAQGPSAIMRLNLETGELQEILADDKTNYCHFQEAPSGGQYVMTRPYSLPRQKGESTALGCLLAPYYLLRGIAVFFSRIGKMSKGEAPRALTNAGVQKKEKTKIEDQLLDIDQILAENQRSGQKYPGIVPGTWKLEKIDAAGERQVIAKGVLDYQLLPSGDILYTNGRHLILQHVNGEEESLVTARMITQIAVEEA